MGHADDERVDKTAVGAETLARIKIQQSVGEDDDDDDDDDIEGEGGG